MNAPIAQPRRQRGSDVRPLHVTLSPEGLAALAQLGGIRGFNASAVIERLLISAASSVPLEGNRQ